MEIKEKVGTYLDQAPFSQGISSKSGAQDVTGGVNSTHDKKHGWKKGLAPSCTRPECMVPKSKLLQVEGGGGLQKSTKD